MSSALLSPTRTRQWLKPSTFAGSLTTAVGMPWEVFRLTNLTPDMRPINLYTKSGGIFAYTTNMVIIPELNVGLSVLAAGDESNDAVMELLDIVIPAVVSSLDQLARQQTEEMYAGEYRGADETAARLSLVVDDGPGLKIKQWTNLGKSMLDFLASYKGTTIEELDARLYPVGEERVWRLGLETMKRPTPSIFSDACMTWLSVDRMRYAKQPVDQFRFHSEDGVARSVENKGLRANLTKV